MKDLHDKLDELVRLATNSKLRIGNLGPQRTKADEDRITATLENLKAIKDLVPIIEGQVNALSSL